MFTRLAAANNINVCLVKSKNKTLEYWTILVKHWTILVKHYTAGLSGETDRYKILMMSLRLGLEEC